ncbi:MAG: sigma-70 family RNA polymerase sigma factor [Ruminococcaceae bacterium]|nr:sigma-70 family RNA polymerase sigma factor [Oscillospiraceae bacterium]
MNTGLIEAVKQAKNGDIAAFDEIYRLTNRSVYFTALKIVGDPADAEDIVQDTYINAFKKLPKLKDDKAFLKWLKVIAVNLSKNHLSKKRPELFESDEQEEQLINAASLEADNPQPEQIVEQKETERIIAQIINGLPEVQQQAVKLFYYKEMPIERIAQVTETNQNTVKSRLNYARKHIKKELEALAKKGTKLYGIPAVTGLLHALKKGAHPTAGLSTAAGGASSVTHTGAAKIAAACIGITVAGTGIAVGVHYLNQDNTDRMGVSIVDNGRVEVDIDNLIEEIDNLSDDLFVLTNNEAILDHENIAAMLGVNALIQNEDGTYAFSGQDGEQIDISNGISLTEFIGFNSNNDALVIGEDDQYYILSYQSEGYGGSYNLFTVDKLEDLSVQVYADIQTDPVTYYYRYEDDNMNAVFEFQERDYYPEDVLTKGSFPKSRYFSYTDGEYSFIGTYDSENDRISGEYLIAVDRKGAPTVIYQSENKILSGVGRAKEEFSNHTINSASVSCEGFVLMELQGEDIEYVLYDIANDTFVVSEGKYVSIEYADRDKDTILLYDGNTYSVCDLSLNVLLDGLTKAEASGSDRYLLITDDKGNGYYNIDTGRISYFDCTTYFSDGYSYVIEDGMGYFVDESLRCVSDKEAETFAVIYKNSRYIYLESKGMIYSFEIEKE